MVIFSSWPCLDLHCLRDRLDGCGYRALESVLYMRWFMFYMIKFFVVTVHPHRNKAWIKMYQKLLATARSHWNLCNKEPTELKIYIRR